MHFSLGFATSPEMEFKEKSHSRDALARAPRRPLLRLIAQRTQFQWQRIRANESSDVVLIVADVSPSIVATFGS